MYIYKITNLVNGKLYIGQTITSIKTRFSKHCGNEKQLISYAIHKYGVENFRVEEIDRAETREELDEKERYWIKHYSSQVPNGYNLESGGNANKEISEETRQKLREAHQGEKAPWYGKHLTEETRAKLSASHMGKCKYWQGKKRSPETIEKISANRKGKTVGASHVQSVKIRCVDTDIVYDSIGEAGRLSGVSRTGIINALKGRSKSAGGHKWEYVAATQ